MQIVGLTKTIDDTWASRYHCEMAALRIGKVPHNPSAPLVPRLTARTSGLERAEREAQALPDYWLRLPIELVQCLLLYLDYKKLWELGSYFPTIHTILQTLNFWREKSTELGERGYDDLVGMSAVKRYLYLLHCNSCMFYIPEIADMLSEWEIKKRLAFRGRVDVAYIKDPPPYAMMEPIDVFVGSACSRRVRLLTYAALGGHLSRLEALPEYELYQTVWMRAAGKIIPQGTDELYDLGVALRNERIVKNKTVALICDRPECLEDETWSCAYRLLCHLAKTNLKGAVSCLLRSEGNQYVEYFLRGHDCPQMREYVKPFIDGYYHKILLHYK